MSGCVGETHVKSVSDRLLGEFDRGISLLPGDLCAPFREEAGKLVSGLDLIGTFAAGMAKQEDDLDKVAELWRAVVTCADECLRRMNQLTTDHPYCRAEDHQDAILDLRNRAKRLVEMHA